MTTARRSSVLVVDDDPDLLDALDDQLASAGFEVVRASDGIDAISYLYARRPMTVVIDLLMPRMNGLDLIAQVRGDRAFNDVRIVAISGAPELLPRARAAGAHETLLKPIHPAALVRAVVRPPAPQSRPDPSDAT